MGGTVLKNRGTCFKKGLKITFIIVCVAVFLNQRGMAQTDIPSYESSSGSVPGGGDNDGPSQSITYDLLLNSNNPNGNSFSTVGSPIEVTISLDSNDAFNGVTQDTDSDGTDGDDGDTDDPAAVLGWLFTTSNGGIDLLYNGQGTDILQSLDALTNSVPENDFFTSLKEVSFISSSPDGDGYDVNGNYGAFITSSFENLPADFITRHIMGTLTVSFSPAVDDPVLHFNGLGGNWFVIRDPGPAGGTNPAVRFYNTATTDLDIGTITGTSTGTPVVLSGTTNFDIESGIIRNTSPNPDVDDDENSNSTLTFAVAHGSVLFPGEDISSIELTLRIRFMEATDLFDSGSTGGGSYSGGTVFGDTDGLGWAGGGTDANNTGDYDIPELNFSSDTWGISASVAAPVSVDLLGAACYRMLTSPTVGTTYSSLLEPLWTQGITGSDYPPSSNPNVWFWPDESGEDPADWSPLSSLNTDIPEGEGFLISVYDDSDYTDSDDASEEGFPKTLTVEGTEHDPPISPSINSNTDGFTLLGNPFKSTILWDNISTSGMEDAVYVYDRNSGGYLTFGNPGDSGVGELTDGEIPPFQGFFVQNDGAAGTVTFTDAAKVTDERDFYGKENQVSNVARFEVNGEDLSNSMWIRFLNSGSLEKSRGDALELYPLTNEYALLGTRKMDGTIFDIGHYPMPNDDFEVPVSFEATQSGYFTITATDLDLSLGYDLYFIDLQKKESILIDENFSYEFSTEGIGAAKTPGSTPGDPFNRCSIGSPKKAQTYASADRFLITTQPKDFTEIPATLSLNQNYPNPFNPTTQISYELPQSADVRLEVYDLVGRQVATLVNQTIEAGAHTVNFDASNLSSGVYIYRLNAGSTVLSRKLTVIK